ncbi:hypothetical protein H0G86_002171 [Trichoderma simmonsii]|uniref:Uncharacterized protein n=1 Tax=Trichoderma simmonsii TaxID=1491479 RepID=A0A8G0L879_9HYPO|nr:hypothetical protein H0G86_002171 [Trichoderma simmonsii]
MLYFIPVSATIATLSITSHVETSTTDGFSVKYVPADLGKYTVLGKTCLIHILSWQTWIGSTASSMRTREHQCFYSMSYVDVSVPTFMCVFELETKKIQPHWCEIYPRDFGARSHLHSRSVLLGALGEEWNGHGARQWLGCNWPGI